MAEIGKKKQWEEILEKTWFCHHPISHPFKKGVPCGICNPCKVAIEEGFGHKIPLLNRLTGKYLKIIYNSAIMNKIRVKRIF